MIRSLAVLLAAMVMAAHGIAAEKKTAAEKKAAVTQSVMSDDMYVEIKAHEAAFLIAALDSKQYLLTGTDEQRMEFARLAQEKKDESEALRKKLLAERHIDETAFNAYEARLTAEMAGSVSAQLGGADPQDLKLDDKNGFNARALKIVQGIAQRARELEGEYKK